MGVSRHEPVIIVGAGPAGLAVAACLRRARIPFLVLEQSDRVGSTWHQHYNRLHLHTTKSLSSLPFFPFPKDVPRFPSRLQVIHYLEDYARHFQISPAFGQQVIAARSVNRHWEVQTQDACYITDNLVIASGYNREPILPAWPGHDSFRGTILHSSQYRTGAPFRGRKVLVVGFGNSGGEIALDLFENGAEPSLAVRGPVNVIPREWLGIPIQAFGILLHKLPVRMADALGAPILAVSIGDLRRYGLQPLAYGPVSQIQRQRRLPLFDAGTLKKIQQGKIHVRPGIDRFMEDQVVFTGGLAESYQAVILATGYRPQVNAFLLEDRALDGEGTPLYSGRAGPVQGLFFCGFLPSPTGMLRAIAGEARRISTEIIGSLPGM